jgi:hypothetical protein
MTEPFMLTVTYKSSTIDYPAQLMMLGYTHKFKVQIDGNEVYFEPDEEGLYRVVQMPGQEIETLTAIDPRLLELLQQKLVEILS